MNYNKDFNIPIGDRKDMTRLSNQMVSDLFINSKKGKRKSIFRNNYCIVHSDLLFFLNQYYTDIYLKLIQSGRNSVKTQNSKSTEIDWCHTIAL